MRYQDASWWRRFFQLGSGADNPTMPFVQAVNLVNDASYRSSRERAPYAQHGATLAAPGAGVHNYVALSGTDTRGPLPEMILHRARFEAEMSGVLNGVVSWALTNGFTAASTNIITPVFGDVDPELSCTLVTGTVAAANLPTPSAIIPRMASIGQTGATPSFPSAVSEVMPSPLLPAAIWTTPRMLVFFNTVANQFLTYHVAWQAVRQ